MTGKVKHELCRLQPDGQDVKVYVLGNHSLVCWRSNTGQSAALFVQGMGGWTDKWNIALKLFPYWNFNISMLIFGIIVCYNSRNQCLTKIGTKNGLLYGSVFHIGGLLTDAIALGHGMVKVEDAIVKVEDAKIVGKFKIHTKLLFLWFLCGQLWSKIFVEKLVNNVQSGLHTTHGQAKFLKFWILKKTLLHPINRASKFYPHVQFKRRIRQGSSAFATRVSLESAWAFLPMQPEFLFIESLILPFTFVLTMWRSLLFTRCHLEHGNFVGRRFTAASLPRLFWMNPRSHSKGATCSVRAGDQLLPVLYHCQLGQDIPRT